MTFKHIPVLLEECIEGLNIKPDGIYVDGTLGGAGHSLEIVKRLSDKGLLIGIDRDEEALNFAKEKLKEFKNVMYVHDNHDNIKDILEKNQIVRVDGILLDLGVSSYQLDEEKRGFSYMQDSPLDMRMNRAQSLTAKDVVNTYKEEDLIRILLDYGEEKFAKRIAKKIVNTREKKQIETTHELVEIIQSVIPYQGEGHPAKRTFQAIRIEVNNEIEPLYNTVMNSINCLKPNGRLCIITFHSLEDRAVKMAYNEALRKMYMPKGLTILCVWCKETRKNNK